MELISEVLVTFNDKLEVKGWLVKRDDQDAVMESLLSSIVVIEATKVDNWWNLTFTASEDITIRELLKLDPNIDYKGWCVDIVYSELSSVGYKEQYLGGYFTVKVKENLKKRGVIHKRKTYGNRL